MGQSLSTPVFSNSQPMPSAKMVCPRYVTSHRERWHLVEFEFEPGLSYSHQQFINVRQVLIKRFAAHEEILKEGKAKAALKYPTWSSA